MKPGLGTRAVDLGILEEEGDRGDFFFEREGEGIWEEAADVCEKGAAVSKRFWERGGAVYL